MNKVSLIITRFVIFIILFFSLSCTINYRENNMLGKRLHFKFMKKKVRRMNQIYGFVESKYIAEKDGISYYVSIDERNYIVQISVYDENFSTPEGIKVGDSASYVEKVTGKKIIKHPLCSYIPLDSGWTVFFTPVKSEDEFKSTSVFLIRIGE